MLPLFICNVPVGAWSKKGTGHLGCPVPQSLVVCGEEATGRIEAQFAPRMIRAALRCQCCRAISLAPSTVRKEEGAHSRLRWPVAETL